jgi:hypothetical protein
VQSELTSVDCGKCVDEKKSKGGREREIERERKIEREREREKGREQGRRERD